MTGGCADFSFVITYLFCVTAISSAAFVRSEIAVVGGGRENSVGLRGEKWRDIAHTSLRNPTLSNTFEASGFWKFIRVFTFARAPVYKISFQVVCED